VLGGNGVLGPCLRYYPVRNDAVKVFTEIYETKGFLCIWWKEAPAESESVPLCWPCRERKYL